MTNRVALVTGAGQAVGQGIAISLAEAGYRVAVNDIIEERAKQTVELIESGGGTAVAAPFDVTDAAAVASVTEQVQAELGPIDIAVNNAGIALNRSGNGSILGSTPDDWRIHIDINMIGSMNVIRAVVPGMVERGWGRVIQITSGAAAMGFPTVGVSLYAGSKAGIEGALRHLAWEVGKSGVTVNGLSIGVMDNNTERLGGNDGPVLKAFLAGIPVGRLGKPSDIGGAAVWLCSEPGSWVTGQTIHINGGAFSGR